MKIIVNNPAASSGGALSILKGFYEHLIQSDYASEHEWVFLLSNNYIKETKNIKVIIIDQAKKSWSGRLKFDFFEGKNIINNLNPDVVISFQNTLVMGVVAPQVLYMHQSLPFQSEKKFSFFKEKERKLAIYQNIIGMLIKQSIKKADKVIVQTKWIKEAVIHSTKIKPEKIVSILPPINNPVDYKKQLSFNKKEFFYPANNSIYKNHECIYNASDLLNKNGIQDYKITLTIDGENTKNFLYSRKIPFERVMKKYNSSTLIFPSYIETVGLPLIEARNMETVILASDCAFSREVLLGYENAYFFNPFNPIELADLMKKVINEKIKRREIKNEKNIENNSWEEVIKLLLSF